MPLSIHYSIAKNGEVGVWDIEEPEDWFLERLNLKEDEAVQFQRLKGRRRLEWLAARQLVHQMSGRAKRALFKKDEFGKPYLKGSAYHISISHSHHKAAAIAAPGVVGIDIQVWVPKIERLAKRFLSAEELNQLDALSNKRLFQLHVLWGAKESLYKAYGRRALDFCQHIRIEGIPTESATGKTLGRVIKGGYEQWFDIHFQQLEGYILVFALAGHNRA